MVSNTIIAIILIGLSSLSSVSGVNSAWASQSLWKLVIDKWPFSSSSSPLAMVEWTHTNDTVALTQCRIDLTTTHAKLDTLIDETIGLRTDVSRGNAVLIKKLDLQQEAITNGMTSCLAHQQMTTEELTNFRVFLQDVKMSVQEQRRLSDRLMESDAKLNAETSARADEAKARARVSDEFREATKYDKHFLAIRVALVAVMVVSIFDPVNDGKTRSITAAAFAFYAFVPVGFYAFLMEVVIAAYAVFVGLRIYAVVVACNNIEVIKVTNRMNRMETNMASKMESMLRLIKGSEANPSSPPAQIRESIPTTTAAVVITSDTDNSDNDEDVLGAVDGQTTTPTTDEGQPMATNPWIFRGPGSVAF